MWNSIVENFKKCDMFEKFLLLVGIISVIVLLLYSFSTKEFNGYYISGGAPYTIYINWENAPDEIAFKTYDKDVLFEAWEILKYE